MNPEIKAKWVAALRSGEYKQGRGQLRIGDRFCCLGVLCDLHGRANRSEWRGNEYDGCEFALSETVQEWAGLKCENPKVGDFALACYNDGRVGHGPVYPDVPKSDFKKIATLIERHL